LLQNGFSRDEVSFLAGDTRESDVPAVGPVEPVGAESEAGQDAWIGGAVGLAAGAIAAAVPGLGLIVAGPIAAAVGGMTVGAAAGGVVGLLKDHGISEEEAAFYAEGVKQGGALVTVQEVSKAREKKAQEILNRHHPIDVEELQDEQTAQD